MKGITLISMMFMLLTVSFGQVMLKTSNQSFLIPKLLNYQGYLTDDQGNPINNPSLSMTFSIYDASSVGNLKWTENQNVKVEKGIFNVTLGGVTPIPDTVFTGGINRWLELIAGGQTLTPRTRITAMGYAYAATYSDTAEYAKNAAADNDWNFLISDGADTTLQMGGRWGIARFGNTLYGNADSTHVNFGMACTTGASGFNYKYCTVAGGQWNRAGGPYATVGGGYNNAATFNYATIGGGYRNMADTAYATVGGGYRNTANGYIATVGGGSYNTARGARATVGGGYSNTADTTYATIGGGSTNSASGFGTTIGGGYADTARGDYSGVFSGWDNNAGDGSSDTGAFVGGGRDNRAIGRYATVGGGESNTASGDRATVGGGSYNSASGIYAMVSGGYQASASLHGQFAHASGQFATPGDAQTSVYVLRGTSTGITWYELYLNGSSTRLTLASGRVLTFDILIVGSTSGGTESAGYKIQGVIKNAAGTTAFAGFPMITTLGEDDAVWDVWIGADNTNDALTITVHGNGETIRWVATVRTSEVAY